MEKAVLETGADAPSQFRAVTERSTVDPLSVLLHNSTKLLSAPRSCITRKSGTHRIGRFLSLLTHNIFGVFNNTDPTNLTNIFRHYLLPDYATEWVANFTSNRTLSFSFNNNMERPKAYSSRLPQGSPISLILFLIYVLAMLNFWPQADAVNASYIDDNAMLQTASS